MRPLLTRICGRTCRVCGARFTLIGRAVRLDQSTLDVTPDWSDGSVLCARADAGNDPGAQVTGLNKLLAALAK